MEVTRRRVLTTQRPAQHSRPNNDRPLPKSRMGVLPNHTRTVCWPAGTLIASKPLGTVENAPVGWSSTLACQPSKKNVRNVSVNFSGLLVCRR